jgi:excisionase family DNA binding protein
MRSIDEFQSKNEHADELGVNPRTIDNWLDLPEDPIPSWKVGNRRLFKKEATREWLERRKVQRYPEPRRRGRPPRAA